MWVLRKTFAFEASHLLPHHDGLCRRLHGHSWRATVEVRGDALQARGPQTGMVLDYADISAAMAPMLAEQLDHHHLNDSTGLDSPTSEALAAWLYGQLKPRLPGLAAVEIDETSSTICRYEP